MYYSNGNYEAFARPKKPEGVDSKNANIIGTGLAALRTDARRSYSCVRERRGARRCL